ncbi:ADP-ribosylation factor-like protein 6-interacting protein 6 [Thunnus thynnus]|uniref:ADP-ribosylation factor-like protein 6-interacting protein 6 n=1 Tax=Thunnus thynnus TaxID=8237 RepID=UPI0035284338
MPSATDGVVVSESLSEDMVHAEPPSVRFGERLMSAERPGGNGGRPLTHQNGPRPWPAVALSILMSSAAVAAVGSFSALLYPILTELRAERVRGEDGTEERMLGFWSILVLSVLVGCICCIVSWTLTYMDSYQPGMMFPTPLTLSYLRDSSVHGYHMGYGIAVLNGIMAMLTVIWSLT